MIIGLLLQVIHNAIQPLLTTVASSDQHFESNPYLLAFLSYIQSFNTYLPITDAFLPIMAIWFLYYARGIIVRIILFIINVVRGSGVR